MKREGEREGGGGVERESARERKRKGVRDYNGGGRVPSSTSLPQSVHV